MLTRRNMLTLTAATLALGAGGLASPSLAREFEITLTEAEWRKRLTPAQFAILRKEDTEKPYSNSLLGESSPLLAENRDGTFHCAACDLPVYPSATKYKSGTGWPSFWDALPGAVGTKKDRRLFTTRTEVHCRRCGGHFGHIFDDGPQPTGKRHCLNGLALSFRPA